MRTRYQLTALLLAALLLLGGCRGGETVPEVVTTPESSPTPPVQTAEVIPEVSPEPSQEAAPGVSSEPEAERVCTLSIVCGELLDRLEDLPEQTRALVPENGVVLADTQVDFEDGESVFDVLQRVCRDTGIHLEFSVTPAYDSAYIEGIANLYEMDCGPLSGWSYTVNGLSPNYGCGQYTVAAGDVICWAYLCDLAAPGNE